MRTTRKIFQSNIVRYITHNYINNRLNQAISNVIENQLEDPQEQEQDNQDDQTQLQDQEITAKYISHFFREKQEFEKEQIYYSPDMRRPDISRVVLSPPGPYYKFATPILNQRSLWQGNANMVPNMNTFNNSNKEAYVGMNNICFSPIHSYGNGSAFYGNYSPYFPPSNQNANTNGNYFSIANNQLNEEQQMAKATNKKKKNKNKSKNNNVNINSNSDISSSNIGKSYISQSPNLKSLFANGKNGQCIKFVPNYISNPLKGEEHNQISLESIINGQDKRTTLMIKNIPNKYTISTFLQEINVNFHNKYDIFYLPIDYGNKCNLGFAFINFVDSMHIIDFYETYRGKKWKRFNSEKICDLVYGKIQGKQELIAHFEKGKVLLFESEDKRPLILQTPSPLPPVTIPSGLMDSFRMAYPFAVYHSVSNDKVIIDSFINY